MLEIQKYWAHALSCTMAQVCMPGISIVPVSEGVGIGEKKITIVKSRLNSVVSVPEEMLTRIRPAVEKIPRLIGVSAKRLAALVDPLELHLEQAEKDYIYYFEPGASLIGLQDGRYELYTLSREDYACFAGSEDCGKSFDPADADKSTIYLGCFLDGQCLAAASLSYVQKRMALIELVCDVDVQDKAAARSLVFHLAEMCLRQSLIVQLRVRAADELLNPLCVEMGFQKLYTLESLSAQAPVVC